MSKIEKGPQNKLIAGFVSQNRTIQDIGNNYVVPQDGKILFGMSQNNQQTSITTQLLISFESWFVLQKDRRVVVCSMKRPLNRTT
jgi:hypothetical protein